MKKQITLRDASLNPGHKSTIIDTSWIEDEIPLKDCESEAVSRSVHGGSQRGEIGVQENP